MRVDVVDLMVGVRRDFPYADRSLPSAERQELRTDLVDEPAAARGDRHVSPSLCFVGFVRLKNLAQNHFQNVSASCAGDPCWSLLNARVPWS